MTAALHPTPTRVQLLADIAARLVTGQAGAWWHRNGGGRVAARVREAQAAGWVADGDPPRPDAAEWQVTAQLTPAGRAVLSAAGRCGRCGVLLPLVGGVPACEITECACGLDPYAHASDPGCPDWGLCEGCEAAVRAGGRP